MPVVSERSKIILLPENPLETKKIPYLEKILTVADNYEFIDAVKWEGRSFGVLTNSENAKDAVRRYRVEDIRNYYEKLISQPQS